jgi:hypothetical protein
MAFDVEQDWTPEGVRRNMESMAEDSLSMRRLMAPLLDDPEFDYQFFRDGNDLKVRAKRKGSVSWQKVSASLLLLR